MQWLPTSVRGPSVVRPMAISRKLSNTDIIQWNTVGTANYRIQILSDAPPQGSILVSNTKCMYVSRVVNCYKRNATLGSC